MHYERTLDDKDKVLYISSKDWDELSHEIAKKLKELEAKYGDDSFICRVFVISMHESAVILLHHEDLNNMQS